MAGNVRILLPRPGFEDASMCYVCCMIQKSKWLSSDVIQAKIAELQETPGLQTINMLVDPDLPFEYAITNGLTTIPSLGAVDVCMTHLLNAPDASAVVPGKKLAIGSADDVRIRRHGNSRNQQRR